MISHQPVRTQTAPRAAIEASNLRRRTVQRQCACGGPITAAGECAECRKKKVQRKTGRHHSEATAHQSAPPIIPEVLRDSGQPLDAATRHFMESRFAHDFSGVRVHTNARAAESARQINALAYTVGADLVFGAGQFAPATTSGRRLIAHELTHVLQQSGATGATASLDIAPPEGRHEQEADAASAKVLSGGAAEVSHAAGNSVQRDLATPPPEEAQPEQDDLTDAQIQEAIRFNRQRYDEANTRLIQEILGGPVTGSWTADNIRAIAETQEEYGLKKDGKVGTDTFEFIVNEQVLEGMGTETENCLTSFRPIFHPVQITTTAGPGGTTRIRGHHVVEARFSSRCDCSEFEYRQFIAGVATGSRGAATQDLSGLFSHIPGGRLPLTMQEDGNTTCPAVNYGHRAQPAQASTTAACGENRYLDDAGTTDQANGCVYRGEDFPQITVNGLNTGDVVDLLVQFRGEIRRNGVTIQTRNWTDIDESVTTP